jgi:hypothetical protein
MTRSGFKPRCKAQVEVVFDGRGGKNSPPFNLEIEPRGANVGLNGFYEADTWNMEFDARLLPFDPDQLAYCAINIFMWDDVNRPFEWATSSNKMIEGLVDDVDSAIVGEDNVVKLTGRDYLALLADSEWDPKTKIPPGKSLVDTIQDIADAAAPKGTRARFEVVWKGEDDPPLVGALHRSTKKKGGFAVKPGKNYWDTIWDLCIAHAYVVHVEGRKIIISEPVTQTKQTLQDSPTLIYGKSLVDLQVKRKFGHQAVPQIVLTAYDPNTGKEIRVMYPEKRNIVVQANADKHARDATGIPLAVKKDDQMFFPAPYGIVDPKALKRYARMQFYHLGRGETTYAAATRHLAVPSTTMDGNEVNLLQKRPGNAIGIKFDPFNKEHLRALEPGQRVDFIVSLGYQLQVATFVANNFDRMDLFKQFYYYNRGDISYGAEDGIELKIEATNFASEVREVNFAENDVRV